MNKRPTNRAEAIEALLNSDKRWSQLTGEIMRDNPTMSDLIAWHRASLIIKAERTCES